MAERPEPLRAVLCIVLCSIQSIQFVINVLVYCDNMTCIALTFMFKIASDFCFG